MGYLYLICLLLDADGTLCQGPLCKDLPIIEKQDAVKVRTSPLNSGKRAQWLIHVSPLLNFIQEPVTWFAGQIKWPVSIWNATLDWNELRPYNRISGLPVQTSLGVWPELKIRPRFEAFGELWVENR